MWYSDGTPRLDDKSVIADKSSKSELPASPKAGAGANSSGFNIDKRSESSSRLKMSAAGELEISPIDGKVSSNLFGTNLRRLLESSEATKIDYAALKIMTQCGAAIKATNSDVVLKQAINNESTLSGPILLTVGTAGYETRISAFNKFKDLCNAVLNGNAILGEEWDSKKKQPQMLVWKTVVRQVSEENIDIRSSQTKKALDLIVTTPMYGALESVLYAKLDYATLAGVYSDEQIRVLANVVVPILLCRLGDDCGPNGFQNLQMCRQNGICGSDLESAVWDQLQSRHLNIDPLRQFVDQRFRALSVLDFSIISTKK